MKAVTAAMVIVALGIAGICVYVSVSGYFLTTNIMSQFQSIMNSSSGSGSISGSGPFHISNTSTTAIAWLPFPLNNTGTVGLDIKDLVVQVTLTMLNGTSLDTSTNAGSIPFGGSKVINITLIDTTLANLKALGTQSIDLGIRVAMTIALPSSWSIFALTLANLEFGLTIPGVQFG